jgi:hypothetical protein
MTNAEQAKQTLVNLYWVIAKLTDAIYVGESAICDDGPPDEAGKAALAELKKTRDAISEALAAVERAHDALGGQAFREAFPPPIDAPVLPSDDLLF